MKQESLGIEFGIKYLGDQAHPYKWQMKPNWLIEIDSEKIPFRNPIIYHSMDGVLLYIIRELDKKRKERQARTVL